MTNWKWLKKKWSNLKYSCGNKCFNCGSNKKLEFCHLEPTNLNGKGRGKEQRYYDIIRNKDKYTFLCKKCHRKYDHLPQNFKPITIKAYLDSISTPKA